MRQKVLSLLSSAGKEYVSGEKISKTLGISRTAVWKHIEALRSEGYVIQSVPKRGYKLVSVPDVLYPAEVSQGLGTRVLGCKICHYHRVDSTNNAAKKLAEEGAPEGTVVIAEQQTKGRGRMNRSWHSPAGGIWMSVILKPRVPPYQVQGITLVAAVAVVNAIKKVTGLVPLIKWPNDIYLEGKKVCGILTEMKGEVDQVNYLIIGIGLNVNSDSRQLEKEASGAGTLAMYLGQNVDRKSLVREMLSQLETNYFHYCREGISSILNQWRQNSLTLGRNVVLKMGEKVFAGVAEDITPEGGLLLRDHHGRTKVFYSGEVTVTGMT
jgi:BirA family biotin operon repressor/biotin-[acetyl-CoA-carboxylase] ligase